MKKDEVQIKKLLGQLEKATDPSEKRQIRVQLRALGHKGGLNRPKAKKAKKVVKKKK